jgi:hypothetical protein
MDTNPENPIAGSSVLSKQLELDGEPIAIPASEADDDRIFDRTWLKVAFMVPNSDIETDTDVINRYYTSASAKFTDTRIGCNIGINPKPQWTRYCDIRSKGRMPNRNDVTISSTTGNFGMGTAYSENLDDPAQKIFMRFGVVQFNSMTSFLLSAFNREQTILARTGRAPSAWYKLGNWTTAALMMTAFPALSITVAVGKTLAWLFQRPTSKFFTIKPTMFLYWNTVNNLVLNHCVNVGIIKKVFNNEEGQRLGKTYTLDQEQLAAITGMFPEVFRNGTVDILAMASYAQRLANAQFQTDYEKLGQDSATAMEGYLRRDSTGSGSHSSYISDTKGAPTLSSWLNNKLMMGRYYTAEQGEDFIQETNPMVRENGKEPTPEQKSHWENMKEVADAEFRDGASFAVFRVDYTGSTQESFGNSVIESDLSQKLNGISSQTAEARFSLMDGNLISGAIGSIVGAVKDIGLGALDAATFGFAGLAAGLGGSGYIDIPKHWQSSNATLPRGSYKIRLVSPYNNPVSRLINIFIPLYMLLAGALPRSVGKQSYTSPFYCQIYDRGRLQARTAMIESISVSRGVSNLAYDLSGNALAIDVSFTVVDLSTIMHMPVSSGSLTDGGVDTNMDDDNIFQDYLSVLAGMDIYSQIYAIPKAQLKLTKELAKLKYKATSPAYHSALFKHALQDGFINDITLGASGFLVNRVQDAVRGNAVLEGTSRN